MILNTIKYQNNFINTIVLLCLTPQKSCYIGILNEYVYKIPIPNSLKVICMILFNADFNSTNPIFKIIDEMVYKWHLLLVSFN